MREDRGLDEGTERANSHPGNEEDWSFSMDLLLQQCLCFMYKRKYSSFWTWLCFWLCVRAWVVCVRTSGTYKETALKAQFTRPDFFLKPKFYPNIQVCSLRHSSTSKSILFLAVNVSLWVKKTKMGQGHWKRSELVLCLGYLGYLAYCGEKRLLPVGRKLYTAIPQ